MEENMNNNEVQNNYNPIPNNNYEEPKKNNGTKMLLIILILLALIIIGLLSYKIFVVDKNNNNENTQVLYDKISYEIKEEEGSKKLRINNKDLSFGYPLIEELKVEQFKDLLIVKVGGPGPSSDVYAVDKDGNVIKFDYRDKERNGELFSYGPEGYRIFGDSIFVIEERQYGNGYIDWYCHYSDTSAIANYEVRYDYLGNGKFSAGEVVNEKPISEVYSEELKSCSSETVTEEQDKINYEIKKVSGVNVLYVDGHEVKETKNIAGSARFKEFNNFVLVTLSGPGMHTSVMAVDKNRNVTYFVDENNMPKFVEIPDWLTKTYSGNKLWNNYGVKSVQGNKFIVSSTRQYGNGYADWPCRLSDTSIIANYEIEYSYNNGKFEGKIVNPKPISEVYSEELKSLKSCMDAMVYTDVVDNKQICIRYNGLQCFKYGNYSKEETHVKEVFKESNCITTTNDGGNEDGIYCKDDKWACTIEKTGSVRCFYNSYSCSIDSDLNPTCGENGIN